MKDNERLLSVEEAAKLIPSNPSPVTVWRWCRRGVKARGGGGTIRMNCVRFGSRLFVRESDVAAFAEALAEADAEHFKPVEISKPEKRPPQRSGNRREQSRRHASGSNRPGSEKTDMVVCVIENEVCKVEDGVWQSARPDYADYLNGCEVENRRGHFGKPINPDLRSAELMIDRLGGTIVDEGEPLTDTAPEGSDT